MRSFGKESISAQNRGSPSPGPRAVGGSRTAAPDIRRAQLCRPISAVTRTTRPADWLGTAGIEQTYSGIQANIQQGRRFFYISIAPGIHKSAAAEGSLAEAHEPEPSVQSNRVVENP